MLLQVEANVSKSSNVHLMVRMHFFFLNTKKANFIVLFLGEINYVRGCINQIEAVRPEMPTVRENGCWTATDQYVVRICLIISTNQIFIFLGFGLSTMVCRSRRADLLFL